MRISRDITGGQSFFMSYSIRFHRPCGPRVTRRAFALALVLGTLCVNPSSDAQEGRRLRAGYTSLSGNMLPLWAAREGGYFKK
ncbi:MAG TPA: hypothetical protein VMR88_01275, partial [Candidatus Polarisedimenticolaceae bacterium]|nr:hypothetical protein [Candidatus Polarisedimenticolaceae bacterium]